MKQLKKTFALLILLTSTIGLRTFAQNQDVFSLNEMTKFYRTFTVKAERENELKKERAKEVTQDNEYSCTSNPLMLDGKPLDFGEFNLFSKGELTVNKEAAITGLSTQIPFYVYLRREGNKVLIPGKETTDPAQVKVDISEILNYAKPGDYLVIEAVNKEDGAGKSILKLLGLGC